MPELTEVDLERSNDAGLSPTQIRASDTQVSSQLQFEDFNPPNAGMKTGTSYFFTTIFPDSVMLFPGDPGSIQGYALDVQAGSESVKEWLTVIRAPGGSVLAGGVIPDDDNDLRVAKGSLDPAACSEVSPGSWNLGFVLGTGGTGSLDGFAFQANVGDQSTCSLTPLPNPSAPAGPYSVSYTRNL